MFVRISSILFLLCAARFACAQPSASDTNPHLLATEEELREFRAHLEKREKELPFSCQAFMSPTLAKPEPLASGGPDPRQFLRIYEEIQGQKRILLYDPRRTDVKSTIFNVDADSRIVVEIDPCLMGPDIPMNQLFMSAHLNHGDKTGDPADIPVLNYSEIGKDAAKEPSQAAVALRTAGDVFLVVSNLYWTTQELLDAECPDLKSGRTQQGVDACKLTDKAAFQDALRRLTPEIGAITAFFGDDKNDVAIGLMGSEIFGMDLKSMQSVAKAYETDVQALSGGKLKNPDEKIDDLFARTKLIDDDFSTIRQDICEMFKGLDNNSKDSSRDYPRSQLYFRYLWITRVMPRFRKLLLPGVVDLPKYKASDGDTMGLRVSAAPIGSEGQSGASADFEFAVKLLRPRMDVLTSAFLVRRFHDVKNVDGSPNRVNFPAAAGVTFTETFYNRMLKREQTRNCPTAATTEPITENDERTLAYKCTPRVVHNRWATFTRALAPGIGVNASVLNFPNSPVYDKTANNGAGGYKTSTASTVQVGTGFVVSLFNNQLQFTYGWDLNANQNRTYWGVGLGFAKIGSTITSALKK